MAPLSQSYYITFTIQKQNPARLTFRIHLKKKTTILIGGNSFKVFIQTTGILRRPFHQNL
jgi:hypothetical protein